MQTNQQVQSLESTNRINYTLIQFVRAIITNGYDIKKIFKELSTNQSTHTITPDIFQKLLKKINKQITDNEVKQIFDYYDADHSGTLELSEFVTTTNELIEKYKLMRQKDTEQAVKFLIDAIDMQRINLHTLLQEYSKQKSSGQQPLYLNQQDVQSLLQHIDQELTADQCQLLFEAFDIEKKQQVTIHAIETFLMSKREHSGSDRTISSSNKDKQQELLDETVNFLILHNENAEQLFAKQKASLSSNLVDEQTFIKICKEINRNLAFKQCQAIFNLFDEGKTGLADINEFHSFIIQQLMKKNNQVNVGGASPKSDSLGHITSFDQTPRQSPSGAAGTLGANHSSSQYYFPQGGNKNQTYTQMSRSQMTPGPKQGIANVVQLGEKKPWLAQQPVSSQSYKKRESINFMMNQVYDTSRQYQQLLEELTNRNINFQQLLIEKTKHHEKINQAAFQTIIENLGLQQDDIQTLFKQLDQSQSGFLDASELRDKVMRDQRRFQDRVQEEAYQTMELLHAKVVKFQNNYESNFKQCSATKSSSLTQSEFYNFLQKADESGVRLCVSNILFNQLISRDHQPDKLNFAVFEREVRNLPDSNIQQRLLGKRTKIIEKVIEQIFKLLDEEHGDKNILTLNNFIQYSQDGWIALYDAQILLQQIDKRLTPEECTQLFDYVLTSQFNQVKKQCILGISYIFLSNFIMAKSLCNMIILP